MTELSGLEPKLLWSHFERILRIPRPSRHEERMRVHVEGWAKERGFSSVRDAYGNLVVRVPASEGLEGSPTIILQGHLDMVCEKEPANTFNFLADEIQAQIVDGWVVASETTLGADNGIGVAAALAVADDDAAVHGPLEILLTVEEELGLKGALKLDGSLLSGRILLNLDSEDAAFYVGCAGASDTVGRFRPRASQSIPPGRLFEISVSGLPGGHSGLSILANPGNAIKILASILKAIRRQGLEFGIVEIHGGSARNAIPRDARAALWIAEPSHLVLQEVVARAADSLRAEMEQHERNFRADCRELETQPSPEVWSRADADHIVDALLSIPHGVLAMSRSLDGLVETSNNLATITTSGGEVVVSTLSRSSSTTELEGVSERIASIFQSAGAQVESDSGYPGWQPDLNSSLLLRAKTVYEQLFAKTPDIRAIHAGLECGVLATRISNVESLSFGPLIEGAHAPGERVHIDSVVSFYQLLVGLLRVLARS